MPAEFLVQSPDVANPPTLFLALADMAQRVARSGGRADSAGAREDLQLLTAGPCAALVLRLELTLGHLVCNQWPPYIINHTASCAYHENPDEMHNA